MKQTAQQTLQALAVLNSLLNNSFSVSPNASTTTTHQKSQFFHCDHFPGPWRQRTIEAHCQLDIVLRHWHPLLPGFPTNTTWNPDVMNMDVIKYSHASHRPSKD